MVKDLPWNLSSALSGSQVLIFNVACSLPEDTQYHSEDASYSSHLPDPLCPQLWFARSVGGGVTLKEHVAKLDWLTKLEGRLLLASWVGMLQTS